MRLIISEKQYNTLKMSLSENFIETFPKIENYNLVETDEYAKYSDERLLKNYNELYKIITLKYGHLL